MPGFHGVLWWPRESLKAAATRTLESRCPCLKIRGSGPSWTPLWTLWVSSVPAPGRWGGDGNETGRVVKSHWLPESAGVAWAALLEGRFHGMAPGGGQGWEFPGGRGPPHLTPTPASE